MDKYIFPLINKYSDYPTEDLLNTLSNHIANQISNNLKDIDKVLVTGGGIIPEEDAEELSSLGVGKLFGPGTPVKESLDYIESWVKEHRR